MGVEVFQCNFGNSLKSFLSPKNQEKMFVQIDDTKSDGTKITGKGYICNEEGKNEYISQFDYPAKDIREVKKGEFQGSEALILITKLQTLYGAKKTQTILPGLKDIDRAIETLMKAAQQDGGITDKVATAAPAKPQPAKPQPAKPQPTKPQPAAEPVAAPKPAAPKPAPQPVKPEPVAPPKPAPAPAPTPAPSFVPHDVVEQATKQPVNPKPAAQPTNDAPEKPAKKEESYEQRMRKLDIMHEAGLCGDDEYKEKKLKLLCDEKGLGSFCDKIQKIFVLRKSGMLSDGEYEANKLQIVDE